MKAVVEQEGFDGFTFGDIHLLLHKLSVSVPEPSGDFVLTFEDADATPLEENGGFEGDEESEDGEESED